MSDVVKVDASAGHWENGVRPFGAISGRQNSQAWQAVARRRRHHHWLELLAASFGGALVALLLVYIERVVSGA